MVKRDYFKLDLISTFYNDQKSILYMLTDSSITLFDISTDANKGAYDEILEKIRDDKRIARKTTVKSLVDFFTKKPYGWRDLDILGMTGYLWKNNLLQILIHDNVVDEKNNSFKNDLSRKANIDTMVVRPKEIIDEAVLYSVKRIMNDTYSENLPLDEAALKSGVVTFFERKRQFLADLKTKYGSDYAGAKVAAEIYQDFQAILRSGDTLTIFNEIIERRDSLYEKAETLEQLEGFYKDGSHQQKNYQDAVEIIDWYTANSLLEDLSRLQPVVDAMSAIVSMDMPFKKMNELADLVFKASEIKEKVIEEKFKGTVYRLNQDRDTIKLELHEATVPYLTSDQKDRLQEKADEIAAQYDSWLNSLSKSTPNMDSYLTASGNSVTSFRRFVSQVLSEGGGKSVRSKKVSVIDCIPVANKKITSAEDVEKVLEAIKKRLLSELNDNDELTLN